jgi:hypothetical protein
MNSKYWLNKIMDLAYHSSTEFWLGLSSTEPTVYGTNISEPVGGGYSRVQITSFSPSMDGCIYNTEQIHFPVSTGVWFGSENKASYWVLFDGNLAVSHMLSYGLLDNPTVIENNTMVSISYGMLKIMLSSQPDSDIPGGGSGGGSGGVVITDDGAGNVVIVTTCGNLRITDDGNGNVVAETTTPVT